jgi:hypothetical protein
MKTITAALQLLRIVGIIEDYYRSITNTAERERGA